MGRDKTLRDLRAKHLELETALADVLAHPAASDEEITALKRQKLRLRDQIASLEREDYAFPEA